MTRITQDQSPNGASVHGMAGGLGAEASVPTLAASWERSMKHGLRRQDRALFNNIVSSTTTKHVEEENRSLLNHASPEMLRLYESLGSARWLALCVNTSGQIVCFTGERSAGPRELQVLMQPGRRLLEAELGTTAPGCVLEERRPVVVVRGEHYLLELEHLFCASAPIVSPDGQLAGALDITGVDVRALPLASDMVGFAVRRIENSMLSAMQDCTLMRFHRDERLLGTPFEAMLAVHPDGTIRGANRTACQLLSLRDDNGVGVSLESVFEGGLDGILRRTKGTAGQSIRVRSDDGSLSFLSIEPKRGSATRFALQRRGIASDDALIVEDPSLIANYEKAVRIVRSGLPVILEGETGTGKELYARALHRQIRPHGPFLALNCAAIPEGLIEAELFGYADGAFTGGRKGGAAGKIEQAHAGVLLLDEIGDMSTALQSRLLRVLQERTVIRIGETREIPVDLLVICATHRDLELMVADGRFREDLYYRLNGVTLKLPPLRERSDIAALIARLFHRWSVTDNGSKPLELHRLVAPAALECLVQYPWPGNIRQLEQVIRALLALRNADQVLAIADLPDPIRNHAAAMRASAATPTDTSRSLEAAQIGVIRKALDDHQGNVSSAARALGISRGTLYGKLKRFGLTARSPAD